MIKGFKDIIFDQIPIKRKGSVVGVTLLIKEFESKGTWTLTKSLVRLLAIYTKNIFKKFAFDSLSYWTYFFMSTFL